MTCSGPTTCTGDDQRAAAIHHRFATSIDVWTSEPPRAADAYVVGAVLAATTEVKGNEEIVVTIFPNDVWSFDRAWSRPAREGVESLILRRELPGCRVQLAEFYAAPKTAERKPWLIVFVKHNVRIDRVPIVLNIRADYLPFIDPPVLVTRWIKRFIRRETDDRVIAAERRGGIIKIILAIEVRHVRRPQASETRHVLDRPLGQMSEHVPAQSPVDQVARTSDRDAGSRRKHVVSISLPNDARIMDLTNVSLEFTLLWPRDHRNSEEQPDRCEVPCTSEIRHSSRDNSVRTR